MGRHGGPKSCEQAMQNDSAHLSYEGFLAPCWFALSHVYAFMLRSVAFSNNLCYTLSYVKGMLLPPGL